MNQQRNPLEKPQKKTTDVADVIWGAVKGTYETQAISDATYREPQTNVAVPSDVCVEEGKEWVDDNHK